MLGLLAGLLRILLVLLVIRLVARFVSAVIRGYRGQFAATKPAPPLGARDLVRDPVCGTFVVPDHALTASVAGDVRYFCSLACRDAALDGAAPKAIHG